MHFKRRLRFHRGLARLLLFRLPDDRAVLRFDAIENKRRVRVPAAVRETRVSQRQFRERDFAAAQKCRGIRTQRRFDSGRLAHLQHGVHARHHPEPHRGAVLRFCERLPRRDRTFVAVIRAFRSPFPENARRAADHDRAIIERGIFHHRSRIKPFLERRRIHERQHRRPGRALRLERAIILAVLKIAPAHEREDAPRFVIERNDRALQILRCRVRIHDPLLFRVLVTLREGRVGLVLVTGRLLHLIEAGPERFLGRLLQLGIERGVNAIAFHHRLVPTHRRDHLLPDELHRIRLALGALSATDHDLLRPRHVALFGRDESQIAHPRQHHIARLARALLVRPGGKPIRALDQTREHRAFRQRHFARRFCKIAARRRFRAIEPAAEINPVQIQLHDLLFPEPILDPAREKNLQQLAPEGALLERKGIARELLRDRARTLPHPACGQILQRRAHDPEKIIAAVLVKFRVLHRHDCVDEIARQLVVGYGLAILHVDLAHDLVVPIQDHARRFHLVELGQVVVLRLPAQIRGQNEKINRARDQERRARRERHIKPRLHEPARLIHRHRAAAFGINNRHAKRANEMVGRASAQLRGKCAQNPNAKRPLRVRRWTFGVRRSTFPLCKRATQL